MRLDVYLAGSGSVKSRETAKRLITGGGVSVNGKTEKKPSADVNESDTVVITAEPPAYVGRGGYKLEKALSVFDIDLNGLVCIDIGASTGGFTDCMLQNGAVYVYAVDVGHDQLDNRLREDSRVCSMEGVNIKDLSAEDFSRRIGFAAADVSFISLTKVIPKIAEILDDNGRVVMLVKPQFECGRGDIGKNGVVKSSAAHARAMQNVFAACTAAGLGVCGADFSPIKGGEGNIEYLFCAVKGGSGKMFNWEKIAEGAARVLKESKV